MEKIKIVYSVVEGITVPCLKVVMSVVKLFLGNVI